MTGEYEAVRARAGRHDLPTVWRLLRGLTPHWSMWLFLVCLLLVNLAWIWRDPRLGLAVASVFQMLLVAFGTLATIAYRELRGAAADPLLGALVRMLLVALFAGLLTQQVNLLSHLMMTLGLPLADARLHAWDQALGFDWNGYVQALGSTPWQRGLLRFAYSWLVSPALLAILFGAIWVGRHDRVEETAFLVLSSGVACVVVAGLMPAADAWFTVATPASQALLGGQPAIGWIHQFEALRGGEPVVFNWRQMEGLATFPSFHACLAIIIIWCSRGRWSTALPGTAAGILILAATPVYGGHYGVDLLGGTAVMAAAILAWRRLGPKLSEL